MTWPRAIRRTLGGGARPQVPVGVQPRHGVAPPPRGALAPATHPCPSRVSHIHRYRFSFILSATPRRGAGSGMRSTGIDIVFVIPVYQRGGTVAGAQVSRILRSRFLIYSLHLYQRGRCSSGRPRERMRRYGFSISLFTNVPRSSSPRRFIQNGEQQPALIPAS